MVDWAGMLLVSLLTGAALGAPKVAELSTAERLETVATRLEVAPSLVVRGLHERQLRLATTNDSALAAETLAVITPLADRLGLYAERASLEDESFRLLNPEAHAALVVGLPPAPALDTLIADTQRLLDDNGIEGIITGRTKSLYSLHQKMDRKGLTAADTTGINDRTGLRIRVQSEEECYRVVALLHTAHTPLAGQQDDYIVSPKPSGYQSLHTGVQTAGGIAEFQVRTHAMHHEAESGPAAHWRYKLSA
ncbi:MAG: (p)ppGpp synthase/HD superfamily hydrolase [Myxococcota bacterium]|jgi:(p)ppGpp synthase/HD superfamily hydrolase